MVNLASSFSKLPRNEDTLNHQTPNPVCKENLNTGQRQAWTWSQSGESMKYGMDIFSSQKVWGPAALTSRAHRAQFEWLDGAP